ncbi:MAG: hypothetical protein IGS48_05275 [Oscillatoriales cyanobacterium C42_A2020_001]|nr:hypothetical protein [Leptolyngbyaceae cyanobacterium C42_A2020_001]
MQRLMDTGLVVLLLAALGVPAHAAPEAPKATTTQAPAKLEIKAKVAQTNPQLSQSQTGSAPLSERDRLILERRLQQLIPSQQ